MRKNLSAFLVCLLACIAVYTHAQTAAPCLPMQDDFGGTMITEPDHFIPNGGEYTLEVEATAGQTIAFFGMSYTPAENGTVRFVQKDNKVYVYESKVFQTVLTPAQIQTTGENILRNPSFEEVGTLLGSNPNRWQPTVWEALDADNQPTWGVGDNPNVREDAAYRSDGLKTIIMHNNARQLLQELPENSLEANAYYLLTYDYWTSSGSGKTGQGNYGSTYQILLRNGQLAAEIQAIPGHTTKNTTEKSSFSILFQASADIPETVWFVLQRNRGDRCDWLDNFKLYKTAPVSKGITGAGGSIRYLEGTAYAPGDLMFKTGDYMDMTSRITNPEFEAGITNNVPGGWNKTFNPNTSKLSTAAKGDGSVITGSQNHWQVWNGSATSGKLYQTLSNLPNGRYTVRAGLYSEFGGSISLYANEGKSNATHKASAYYEATGTVTDGTLEIGLDIATTGTTTIELDHFTLRYDGPAGISFEDSQDYQIPATFDATVSYTRNFSAEGVSDRTNNGWQTLSLPFHVNAIQIEDEYTNSPIDLTEEANRKFWLFRIKEGRYEEASTIEANQYYLIALPNAPEYYVPEINLKGKVTFSGTRVETPALQPVGMNGYSIVADYKKTNTGYGITDENNETVFKQGVCNGAFWPHALPSINGASTRFYVFGPTPTSVRQVMAPASVENAPGIISVQGGVEITTPRSQMIPIHTADGRRVKHIRVPEGTSVLHLHPGAYIIAGQKVIVND